MPRNRSAGRPAPSWPTAPARAASAPQQRRPASTVAAPPAKQHAPQQMATPGAAQSQGSGLFGQMASTAAGVAIGSSVGHAIGGFFSAGASEPAPQPAAQSQAQNAQQQEYSGNCQSAALQFNKCMDEQRGDMQICNWYLEQLKACQAATRPY